MIEEGSSNNVGYYKVIYGHYFKSLNSRMTHGQHRCIKFLKLISKFISNSFVLHREPTTVSVMFIGGFSNVSRMWKRPLNWSCVDCLSLCISFSWYYERKRNVHNMLYHNVRAIYYKNKSSLNNRLPLETFPFPYSINSFLNYNSILIYVWLFRNGNLYSTTMAW